MKVALAARLRSETTMRVGWIAERLAMGTRGYLNHLLYRRRKLSDESTTNRPFYDPFTGRAGSEGTLSALNRNAVRLQIGVVSGLRRNTRYRRAGIRGRAGAEHRPPDAPF